MLQRIRAACARVAERARFVRAAGDLDAYLASFEPAALTRPAYDTTCHYRGDPEATVAYVLVLDAVNFGSGYFPALRPARGERGYRLLASGLTAWFEAEVPDADRLGRVDAATMAEVLGQDLEDPLRRELMRLYAEALRELGGYVTSRFRGSFAALVAAAGHSAERLAVLLAEMPFFRDVWRYDGLEVPFYKRAQIAASDLALALGEAGYGAFNDLGRLTMFADNQVPHVLRCDGVLAYAPALARRIDRGERLRAGSPEEIELRAVALCVVERLVAAGRARGLALRARDLDAALWERGQAHPYAARSPHLTLTTAY